MQVDRSRLREDIETNGEFGAVEATEGRGRTVLTGTEADRQAREYFRERLEAAGLSVRVDAIGNVAGRWVPDGADPDAAPIAAGSHLDSVPRGGIFDGPLGVYAALEAVRALQASDRSLRRPIEVVSFTEEEGQRFYPGLVGSAVASGVETLEWGQNVTDEEGVRLETALEEIGYLGSGRLEAERWDAWLELHVEQHDSLERQGGPIGLVTTIAGIVDGHVTVTGTSNHAGATPMDDRTDALAATSEFVLDVERAARELSLEDESLVGAVSTVELEPNTINVVPGRVEVDFDTRGVDYDALKTLRSRMEGSLKRLEDERGVETVFEISYDHEPVPMSDRLQGVLRAAGQRADVETTDLHSAALHDTGNVAAVTDAAMLFAPSQGGYSHSPREWTDWDDCARGAAVLAEAMADLASD